MSHSLRIKNAKKVFDDYVVFNNVNYTFESGKMYALVGPSGGGKTTLLNSIGRLNDLSAGTIILDDKNINTINILNYYREIIGYLFQNYALVDEDNVMQNLNIVKKYKFSQLREHIGKFDLADSYLKRKIYTLSGGEAQRVALTRLSLQDPLIVLADELTSALDNLNRKLVLDSLRQMANDGKIVIIATNDDIVKDYVDEQVNILDFK
ncbi:MAG: ATP-binding cassette domain-containing protein [Liquorilactobacillus hordei]|uniref:ATP-binding cassette domain-containing protein n=1 Tax=Liquorilactobacillus hordei TaxID=468911 RepID=UPI0039EB34E4